LQIISDIHDSTEEIKTQFLFAGECPYRPVSRLRQAKFILSAPEELTFGRFSGILVAG
jgi:hypothetical protein